MQITLQHTCPVSHHRYPSQSSSQLEQMWTAAHEKYVHTYVNIIKHGEALIIRGINICSIKNFYWVKQFDKILLTHLKGILFFIH